MRLLHVTPTYLPATRYGGPIYSVHGLCAALAERGHDVHVFTTDVDGPGRSQVPISIPQLLDNVFVTYFPTGLGRRLYRSPSMAAALDRGLGAFDLIHLHSVFLWPTTAAALRARRLGVPYVVSPRGMLVRDLIRKKSRSLKSMWIAAFERRNISNAAAVHVTSEIEAEEILALGFALRRLSLIPNGVDPPTESRYASLPDPFASLPRPIVLFLGRISWKKGLDRLIPALAHVPKASLVIAGPDDEKLIPHLQQLAADSGVAARTYFSGPLIGDKKWRALASADVFALPSYSENFGIAAVEAMALGVPIVLTAEVGVAAAAVAAQAGIVVPGDPAQLGAAIADLIERPAQRAEMSCRGRKLASKQYSWRGVAGAMEALYDDLLRDRKSTLTDQGLN